MNDSAIQILNQLVRVNPDVKGDRAKAKAGLTIALSKKPSNEEESKIKDLVGK